MNMASAGLANDFFPESSNPRSSSEAQDDRAEPAGLVCHQAMRFAVNLAVVVLL